MGEGDGAPEVRIAPVSRVGLRQVKPRDGGEEDGVSVKDRVDVLSLWCIQRRHWNEKSV